MHGCSEDMCEICFAEPDEDGWRRHGRGCYVVSEDGGGSDSPGALRMRVPDQPAPIAQPDVVGSWSLVIADAQAMDVPADVIDDMRERDTLGRARYGTPLTAGNGRKHLVDAYQEALDLVVYIRTEITERGYDMNAPIADDRQKRLGSLYASALAFVYALRVELTANL